jgi:cell division protein FtsB
MPSKEKMPPRQILLLVILALIALLVVRQYLGVISLPTLGKIDEQTQLLGSKRSDLMVLQKEQKNWLKELEQLNAQTNAFWVVSSQRALIEQEVTKEFGKILRAAQVVPQKVESQRNKMPQYNHVSEVEIIVDLRGVSMQELSRLFQEVEKNRRRLAWSYARIEPDNARDPKSVNATFRLKAFTLAQEATDFLLARQGNVGSPLKGDAL